jgi:hypothetical protein
VQETLKLAKRTIEHVKKLSCTPSDPQEHGGLFRMECSVTAGKEAPDTQDIPIKRVKSVQFDRAGQGGWFEHGESRIYFDYVGSKWAKCEIDNREPKSGARPYVLIDCQENR